MTAEPAPQVSQAIATATLREEDGRLDGALRTRTLLDAYPWGAVRAQPHPERTLALG